jgi:hypothetical protein
MHIEEIVQLRRHVEPLVTEVRATYPSPVALGIWLLEILTAMEDQYHRLEQKADRRELEALNTKFEDLDDLIEDQAQTISALIEANDDLRAQLSLARRKPQEEEA